MLLYFMCVCNFSWREYPESRLCGIFLRLPPSLPVACRMVGDIKLGRACMGMRLVCSRVPYVVLFPDLLKVNCLIIYSTEKAWETFT